MASSTSHSNADRHHYRVDLDAGYRPVGWWKIAGFVVIGLLLLEVVSRVLITRASHDLSRYKTYPTKAKQLAQSSKPRIAFVGNSATDEGVDDKQIAAEWKARGFDADTDLFVADDSWVQTWENIIERYFWTSGNKVDVIVINHFGPEMLVDGERIDLGRLGQSFSTYRDWPRLFSTTLSGLSKQSEFALSAISATYGFRKRIKDRVSNLMVPDYKGFKTELTETANRKKNFVAGGVATANEGKQAEIASRLGSLSRLVSRAREHNCKIVFVSFPMRGSAKGTVYSVNPVIEQWLADKGLTVIDLRQQPTLLDEVYKDEYHLNKEGKKRYSSILAAKLLEVLQPKDTK